MSGMGGMGGMGGGMGGTGGMGGGMGGAGAMGGMGGQNNCPFSPCIMDQFGGGGGGGGGGAGYPNPGMGMGNMGMGMGMGNSMGMGMGNSMGMGMGMGGQMSPCMECGQIPNAACMAGRGGPMTPCIECGQIPNAACMPPSGGAGGGGNPNVPCIECANKPNPACASTPDPPPPEEPEGDYQEIGATMGGNTLTIRVHKSKNKVEQMDPNAVYEPEESDGNGKGCSCVMGSPGKRGKNQSQALNMRPGVQQGNENMPFAFKMGKSGTGGDNSVVVNPPVSTTPDGAQFTEFSDPNKELYILRVGKKTEGPDKRQNLELELCTPKPLREGPKPPAPALDAAAQAQGCRCARPNGDATKTANGSNGNGKNGNGKNGDGKNGNGKNGNGKNGNGKNGNGKNGKNGNGKNGDGKNGDGKNGDDKGGDESKPKSCGPPPQTSGGCCCRRQ